MLLADFSTVPGFEAMGDVTHYGSKVFEKAGNPGVRLTVIMANRLPLEQQTGADLIYFNEVDKGGHFAAWEQPELFSAELRAAFKPLRQPN